MLDAWKPVPGSYRCFRCYSGFRASLVRSKHTRHTLTLLAAVARRRLLLRGEMLPSRRRPHRPGEGPSAQS
eukprot:5093434-Prymnesium_polylepis.1